MSPFPSNPNYGARRPGRPPVHPKPSGTSAIFKSAVPPRSAPTSRPAPSHAPRPGTETGKPSARPHRFNGAVRPSHPPRVKKMQVQHHTASDMRFDPRRVAHTPIPPVPENAVRIIPLGGVEEIGRNMTAIEYGGNIFIVDCGFAFSEDETPGIDYILPNTGYLEERRDKIRGIFITHGHLDHIGGIPYVMDRIGNPTIYTRKLTAMMIKKRQEEFSQTPLTIREVERDDAIHLGGATIRFYSVTHTVPDSMGVIFETPNGDVVFTGDVKLDHVNGEPTEDECAQYAIFRNRKVLALCMESTNTWQPGFSIPERTVFNTFQELLSHPRKGRVIIGTFASQLERLIKIIEIAEGLNKRVVIDGRSMRTNLAIARELGLFKHKDETIVEPENMGQYKPEQLVILATGAQGDEFASLMRIANKTHKFIRLTPDDTIILSSSVIPGNERAVQKLKDNLSRQGSHIITIHTSDVHASGHGNRGEAMWIHQQIRPKFFMPMHGYHYMLRVHADLAEELGVPHENIAIPDNGSMIEITGGEKIAKLPMKAPNELRVVEGHTVSELSDVLMRDRKALSQEGFCVVVTTVDRRTGKLHKSPDIISRGFVYLRDNKDLMDQTRLIIRKSVEMSMSNPRSVDLDTAREDLAEAVSRFLLARTLKRPIVIPVIVTI